MTDPCAVPVRRLDPDLPLPSYAHPGDAGADLCARVDVTIEPGERVLVPTGVALALPAGHAGFVHPRSGLAARHGISIVNAPGTVDEGYRGEILVNLVNLDRREPFTVRRGDRIAQLVVQRVERVTFVEVDSLDETGRGDTGHGSTGGFGPGGAASPTRGETQRETLGGDAPRGVIIGYGAPGAASAPRRPPLRTGTTPARQQDSKDGMTWDSSAGASRRTARTPVPWTQTWPTTGSTPSSRTGPRTRRTATRTVTRTLTRTRGRGSRRRRGPARPERGRRRQRLPQPRRDLAARAAGHGAAPRGQRAGAADHRCDRGDRRVGRAAAGVRRAAHRRCVGRHPQRDRREHRRCRRHRRGPHGRVRGGAAHADAAGGPGRPHRLHAGSFRRRRRSPLVPPCRRLGSGRHRACRRRRGPRGHPHHGHRPR